ncbi:MAG TPA: hypothetical protein EYP28_05645 [Methanophagales archaeon]|nr:hypothetical protein [Methanophagales archaeon]
MKCTYEELFASFRRGLRNGNWKKLSRLEKALYRVSLGYSSVQGAIIKAKEYLHGRLRYGNG